MSSLDDQAEVRRKGTTVTSASGLLIWIWTGQIVGKFSRALEHLAIVVGTVGIFDFLCQRSCLFDGMGDTDQVAPGNAVEGVTSSTHLAIDLETTADAGPGEPEARFECGADIPSMIKRVKQALVWPRIRGRVETVVGERVCVNLTDEGEGAV